MHQQSSIVGSAGGASISHEQDVIVAPQKVKIISFKIKSVSKEITGGKAVNLIDPDQRFGWNTGSNQKEQVILELDEPCLLSNVKIVNKAVSEWEITGALSLKDNFSRVKSRCEPARREVSYSVPLVPVKLLKVFCFRGNPISITHIQVSGVPIMGLESEHLALVEFLLPRIVSAARDPNDPNLKLFTDSVAKLPLSVISLLQHDFESGGGDDTVRLLSHLVESYFPIVSAALSSKEIEQPIATPTAAMETPSDLGISSNFRAPPVVPAKKKPIEFDSPVFVVRKRRDGREAEVEAEPELSNVISLAKSALKSAPLHQLVLLIADAIHRVESHLRKDFAQISASPSSPDWSVLLDETRPKIAVEALLNVLFAAAETNNNNNGSLCSLLNSALKSQPNILLLLLPLLRVFASAQRQTVLNSHKRGEQKIEQIPIAEYFKSGPILEKGLPMLVTLCSNSAYRSLLSALTAQLSSNSASQEAAACLLLDLATGPLQSYVTGLLKRLNFVTEEILSDSNCAAILQNATKEPNRANAFLLFLKLISRGFFDSDLSRIATQKSAVIFLCEILPAAFSALLLHSQQTNVQTNQFTSYLLQLVHDAIGKPPAVFASLEAKYRATQLDAAALLVIISLRFPATEFLEMNSTIPSKKQSEPSIESVDTSESSKYFLPANAFPGNADEVPVATAKIPSSLMSSTVGAADSLEEYFQLDADYIQLNNLPQREVLAMQFMSFAEESHKKALALPKKDDDLSIALHRTSIDSVLFAAEALLNARFLALANDHAALRAKVDSMPRLPESQIVSLEEHRDRRVLEILLQAARWEAEFSSNSTPKPASADTESNFAALSAALLSSAEDFAQADVVTFARVFMQPLFSFITLQLLRQDAPLSEVLLQGLIYLLRANSGVPRGGLLLRVLMTSLQKFNARIERDHQASSFSNPSSSTSVGISDVRRYWASLLVALSAAVDSEVGVISLNEWLENLDAIIRSPYVLVRYFGWMGTVRSLKRVGSYRGGTPMSVDAWSAVLRICADEALTNTKEVGSDLQSWLPNLHKDFAKLADSAVECVCNSIQSARGIELTEVITWFSEWLRKDNVGLPRGPFNRVTMQLLRTFFTAHQKELFVDASRLLLLQRDVCSNAQTDYATAAAMCALVQPLLRRGGAFLTSALLEQLKLSELCLRDPPADLCILMIAQLLSEVSQIGNLDLSSKLVQEIVASLKKPLMRDDWSKSGSHVEKRLRAYAVLFGAARRPSAVGSPQSAPLGALFAKELIPALWEPIDSAVQDFPQLVRPLIAAAFECARELPDGLVMVANQAMELEQRPKKCWRVAGVLLGLLTNSPSPTVPLATPICEALKIRISRAPRYEWRREVVAHFGALLSRAGKIAAESLSSIGNYILSSEEPECQLSALLVLIDAFSGGVWGGDGDAPSASIASSLWQSAVRLSRSRNEQISNAAALLLEHLVACIPKEDAANFVSQLKEVWSIRSQRFGSRSAGGVSVQLLATTLLFHPTIATSIPQALWESVERQRASSTLPDLATPHQILYQNLISALLKLRTISAPSSEELKEALTSVKSTEESSPAAQISEDEQNRIRSSLAEVLVRLERADAARVAERDEVASAAERLRALEMEYELLLRHRMAMLDSNVPVTEIFEPVPNMEDGAENQSNFTPLTEQHAEMLLRIEQLEKQIESEKTYSMMAEVKSQVLLERQMRHERAVAYHRAKLSQIQREIAAFNDIIHANQLAAVAAASSTSSPVLVQLQVQQQQSQQPSTPAMASAVETSPRTPITESTPSEPRKPIAKASESKTALGIKQPRSHNENKQRREQKWERRQNQSSSSPSPPAGVVSASSAPTPAPAVSASTPPPTNI